MNNTCEVCGVVIHTMGFNGTGVCGEEHDKVRQEQMMTRRERAKLNGSSAGNSGGSD